MGTMVRKEIYSPFETYMYFARLKINSEGEKLSFWQELW